MLVGRESLNEHRPQAVEQLSQLDVVFVALGQHLVHRGDREDPVHRVEKRLTRVDSLGPRLQPQQRGDGLQVVLDTVMDLLGENAAHDGAPVLERDRRLLGDRREQLAIVLGEG